MIVIAVPLLLFLSSLLMAFAWLGHIRLKDKSFLTALVISWLLVLPEYLLNVGTIRWGIGTFDPSEMAAMNLSTGVICVALVSKYFLGEVLNRMQVIGFVLMALSMVIIVS